MRDTLIANVMATVMRPMQREPFTAQQGGLGYMYEPNL